MGCQSSSPALKETDITRDSSRPNPNPSFDKSPVDLSQHSECDFRNKTNATASTDTPLLYNKNNGESKSGELDLTQHEIHYDSAKMVNVSTPEIRLPSQELPMNGYTVNFSGKSKKGFVYSKPNKPNQDSIGYFTDEITNTHIFFAMDGHGQFGHEVVAFCDKFLKETLSQHPLFSTDIKIALKETIVEMDRNISGDNKIDTNFSGTTLVLVSLRDDKLIVANVGDSRSIMIRSGESVVQITTDHKASLPEEYSRIVSQKGRVMIEPSGLARIYLTSSDLPGLSMSRSIGDTMVHSIGVTAEPELIQIDLKSDTSGNNNNQFLLFLGTDGIFDVMNNETLCGQFSSNEKLESKIDTVISDCVGLWMNNYGLSDDISLIVVRVTFENNDK